MRILFPLLLAATLSLAPLTAALTAALAETGPSLTVTGPTLTVTGIATIETTPDLATLSLGVSTTGATARAAMAANSDAVAAVIARLKSAGVADRDIQTSNLSLNPNWVTNASGTASEVQGYIVTNMVSVRIRAIATTGTVVDAAISDGVNTLNGLYFSLQDTRPAEDEARKKAVADALARATLLAEATGTRLGPILSVTEGSDAASPQGPMYRMSDATGAVPVEAGSVGVSASVTIVFQIGE